MSITGDIAALHKLQETMADIAREADVSCADAVGIVLAEEIHRASIQVVGPVVEIHRYLPRPAYLSPRLARLTEDTIDAHLAEMVTL
jgi:hypothetical protein